MDWIKRNLYFVIGSVVALLLLGGAGFYFYSSWKANSEVLEKIHEQYANLDRLNHQAVHPGRPPQSDNIKLAKEQQQQLRDFLQQERKAFDHIPSIPEGPKVAGEDFITSLRHTIDQLQKAATNSSIGLPPDYSFSFATQRQQMRFATNVLDALARQLGEVKAICDVLFQAKVNSLEYIHRERVAPEDSSGTTDYLNQKSTTNEMAVLTPYELKFKCFTPELAATLSGFASSSNGLIVKTINVEPAPATEAPLDVAAAVALPAQVLPQPQTEQARSRSAEEAFRRRYGLGGGENRRGGRAPSPAPPQVVQQPIAATPTPSKGLQTVLDEKQLVVTMMLNIVKLLPSK